MANKVVYALWGEHSGTPLSQDGRVIFHTNREEMEFLFPGTKVKPIDIDPLEGLPLKFAKGMEAVQFPLDRSEFRCRS